MKIPFAKIANDKQRWYPCTCTQCGWIGSSEDVGTDNMECFDDSDIYCPRCGAFAEEYEHDRYPLLIFFTDLISRFKGWRIRKHEAKYWKKVADEMEWAEKP